MLISLKYSPFFTWVSLCLVIIYANISNVLTLDGNFYHIQRRGTEPDALGIYLLFELCICYSRPIVTHEPQTNI